MMRRRGSLPVCLPALAIVACVAMISGCGSSGTGTEATTTSSRNSATSTTSSAATPGSTTSTSGTTAPSTVHSVAVYFLRDGVVGGARRSVPAPTPAAGAMEALLAGPTSGDARLTTAIPIDTKLRKVTIAAGTATVDLSTTFGTGGGSTSMQQRVAQVVFTLTQFPSVQRVSFEMAGTPVTALGGEGLMIGTPQTRSDWESMSPAILVEHPLPSDRLTSPFTISGTANTFEATFQVTLTDSAGASRYDHYVTATSGTGTRGSFSQRITFQGAATGPATLQVYEASAKDGSHINVVNIPVVLS